MARFDTSTIKGVRVQTLPGESVAFASSNAMDRDREILQESKETPRETTSRYIGLWIKGWERFFPKIVDRILRGD